MEMLARGAAEEEIHCRGGIYGINFKMNDITSEGVKHLLSLPKQLINELNTLDLSWNKLDSKSCSVLSHLIPHVPRLKTLILYSNHDIGKGRAVPLITSLTPHDSLEELELDSTGIGVEDCRALTELLSSSTNLKELDISRNYLSPEAIELIISGLHHNTTLKKLNMSCSYFSPKNTISLASVLRTNHTLYILNLSLCNIDSDGACELASALCTNITLCELYLSANLFGDKEVTAFEELLLNNWSLNCLDLQGSSISEKGTQKLVDSLTHNRLVSLYLPEECRSFVEESEVTWRVIFPFRL